MIDIFLCIRFATLWSKLFEPGPGVQQRVHRDRERLPREQVGQAEHEDHGQKQVAPERDVDEVDRPVHVDDDVEDRQMPEVDGQRPGAELGHVGDIQARDQGEEPEDDDRADEVCEAPVQELGRAERVRDLVVIVLPRKEPAQQVDVFFKDDADDEPQKEYERSSGADRLFVEKLREPVPVQHVPRVEEGEEHDDPGEGEPFADEGHVPDRETDDDGRREHIFRRVFPQKPGDGIGREQGQHEPGDLVLVVETEPVFRLPDVDGEVPEEPEDQTDQHIGQEFFPVVFVRLNRPFGEQAGDEEERRHMETVDEQEEAPVITIVFTAPFDGVPEDDEKDEKELRVVPARVAFDGWQRIRSFLSCCGWCGGTCLPCRPRGHIRGPSVSRRPVG